MRAEALAPLEIRLGPWGHERVWTRWLFRYVEPTAAVMEAHAAACRQFSCRRPYTPHMSFLYGELDPPPSIGMPVPERFMADTLHVVLTDGPVAAWRPLAAVALGRTRGSGAGSVKWQTPSAGAAGEEKPSLPRSGGRLQSDK